MAKTAPKEVLVKKKIKDGLTKERMLQIMIQIHFIPKDLQKEIADYQETFKKVITTMQQQTF